MYYSQSRCCYEGYVGGRRKENIAARHFSLVSVCLRFLSLSHVLGAGHEGVFSGTHGDRDDLGSVPGQESEKAAVVQRQVSHGLPASELTGKIYVRGRGGCRPV